VNFVQLYTPGLAHCSYVLGSPPFCVVVDPSRDVDRYLQLASELDLTIAAIIETHLHADFVSGHLELASLTGAPIYAPASARCAFPHVAVEDGQQWRIGDLQFTLLATPGHTPECSVVLVADLARGPEPALALTGDTLLVGDVGRPDLFPDIAERLAADLYHSLRRLESLRDGVEVYPAHGMGSLCGRSLSAKLSSTIGNERLYNYAFHLHPQEEFSRVLLEGQPPAPDHFSRCSEINRLGPALLSSLPAPAALAPGDFKRAAEQGALVLDTRDQMAFAAAHVPDAYCIALAGTIFSTFSGWVLPPDRPILLVLERKSDLEAALTGLRRVGLDRVDGYLAGGMEAWAQAGLETRGLRSVSIPELQQLLAAGGLQLVDTRSPGEWQEGHIEGARHIPTADLRYRYTELDPAQPVAVICNTGARSVLGASLLAQRGFRSIINVIGGTTAWKAAGLPLVTEAASSG
jgi:glyoxylase-like metal-dependent hydrolase (beta-lactamase superfamily II)/rhodanese-related sulfurtransferase